MSGEVGHDVETFFLAEDTLEDRVGKVECVTAELIGNIESLGGAHITHQLGKAVLVEVNDHHTLGLETQYGLDEAGADTSGTSNHSHFLALYFLGQFLLVRLDVWSEHARRVEGDTVGDEFV